MKTPSEIAADILEEYRPQVEAAKRAIREQRAAAAPYKPILRETVGLTTNAKRRLVTMANRLHPDAPIGVAMWRVVSDGLDALEREAAREEEVRRVAREAGEVYRRPCACPEHVVCSCGAR